MKLYKCSKCKKEERLKNLCKIGKNRLCSICYKERLNERKEERIKQVKSNIDREKTIKKLEKSFEPKIKRSKKKSLGRYKQKSLYITREEKDLLFRKYRSLGYNNLEAGDKVREICERMKELVKKLKEKKISKEEINIRFKEEFAKLCEEY